MRKVFLEDLPKRGKFIDWEKSKSKFVKFIYYKISGEFQIMDYYYKNNYSGLRIVIKYKNNMFDICSSQLKKGALSVVLGFSKSKKLIKGVNDIATTHPEMVKLFLNSEIAYNHSAKSRLRTDFVCLECKSIIKDKIISNITTDGVFCPKCSDGVSYPEKIILNLLSTLNIKFTKEKRFNWSNNYRYDFYLEKYNWIIEVHGEQHYKDSNWSRRNEKENDKRKEELARKNNIDNYIVIDARYSNLNFIKDNITNSDLSMLLKSQKVDWEEIDLLSQKSLMVMSCKMRSEENLSPTEIGNRLGLARTTIGGYLRRGNKLGICKYDGKKEIQKARINSIAKEIACVNTGEIFSSIKEAAQKMKIKSPSLSAVCRGKRKSAGGYKWMYKEDYDKYLAEQNKELVLN